MTCGKAAIGKMMPQDAASGAVSMMEGVIMFDAAVGVWVTLIVVLVIVAAVLGAALFIVPQ